MNTLTTTSTTLITAALQHLALERAAACVLPVPDTDPRLFVAVGRAPDLMKLLDGAEAECPTCNGAREVSACASRYDDEPQTKPCPDCEDGPDPDKARDAMQDRGGPA